MRLVKHLLDEKGSAVYSAAAEESVRTALEKMAEHGIGALVVLRGGELVGLVSERDYARKVILLDRTSSDTSVGDIMSTQVVSVTPDTSVEECMQICTRRRVRHLPVLDDGMIVGLVSIGDLVKTVIDDQSQEIEQLQRYIAG